MLGQMAPYKSLYVASVICTAFGGLMALLDPLILKWLIDIVLPQKKVGILFLTAAGFLAAYFSRLYLNNAAAVLNFRATQSVLLRIRTGILRHMQTLSAEFYDRHPTGAITFSIEQDVDKLREAGGDFILMSLRTVLFGIFILATMFIINLPLTCLVLPMIPLFLIVRRRYDATLQHWSEIIQERASRSSAFLQEALSSVVQVQILRREATQLKRYFTLGRSALHAQVERRKSEAFYAAFCSLIIALGLALVLGIGGYAVTRQVLTIGSLVAFYSYVSRLFDPLTNAVDIQMRVPQLKVSIHRILQLLDSKPAVVDRPSTLETPGALREPIVFRNVKFGYQDRAVLNNFDCEIRPGSRTVLVGSSGSGKSTIAKLLLRLYDVEEGEILIGSRDIRDFKIKSLRSVIGLVPQDPVLFDGTLRDNLLLGNSAITQEQLEKAVRITQLNRLVAKLPRGWEEYLGPRGTMLSGGEKQRLALAQTVLRRPGIFVLDESTSALDTPTEAAILCVLNTEFREQTVLLISHRPSVMLWADQILLVDNGKLAAAGTHDQLYESSALYRKIFHEEMEKENQLGIPLAQALANSLGGEA
jgi:ABC-type multidrug transport system fused ATPase/permease subunit